MIAILGAYSLLLRGVLLYMTCVVNAPREGTVGSEVYTCQTSQVYDGIMLHRHCQFDLTCETSIHRDVTKMDSSVLWSTALHARVTMACAGDIETNPGPPKLIGGVKTRQSTLSFQEDLGAEKNEGNAIDLNDVMKELKSIKTEFGKRFDQVDSKIDEQVEKLKQQLEEVKTDQTESRKEINEIRKENRFLRRRLNNIEGQSRRNNIIVRGIPETEDKESWDDCEQAVRECLQRKLEMNVDEMSIERAHRLPRNRNAPIGAPRDMIIKLSFWKEKMNIIKKAKEIKPHDFYFMEDYCDDVKLARGKLKATLTNARNNDLNAYLSFDKLVVVNDNNRRNIYVYDDVIGDVKCQIRNFDDKLTDANENKRDDDAPNTTAD